ncbi:MAG: hypothetical protein WBX12_09575 [Candidatus Acidiferrales bacterium]
MRWLSLSLILPMILLGAAFVPRTIPLGAAFASRMSATETLSWSVQTTGRDTNLRGASIAFSSLAKRPADPMVWFSGSNGTILRSDDLGVSWTALHVPGAEALDFRGIVALDYQTAYAMSSGEGDKSRIYKTADGGATWKLQYSGTRSEIFLDSVACTSSGNSFGAASSAAPRRSAIECYALGDPVDGKFLLLRSDDGATWKELPRDAMPAALPGEGAFAASGTCIALGPANENGGEILFGTGGTGARGPRVFRSSDGGITWMVAETPLAHGNPSSGIFSVARLPGDGVVAVGGDYKDPNGAKTVAAYSRDRGATWHLAAQQPGGFRSAVGVREGLKLLALGTNGEDASDDGGIHWRHLASLELNTLAIASGANAWAAGPQGTIARLTISK